MRRHLFTAILSGSAILIPVGQAAAADSGADATDATGPEKLSTVVTVSFATVSAAEAWPGVSEARVKDH